MAGPLADPGGILVKKVIFIEKGNTHVMPGHQEKIHVTIEIINGF